MSNKILKKDIIGKYNIIKEFPNGDFIYREYVMHGKLVEDVYHLISDGKEIAVGREFKVYDNGDISYEKKYDGLKHLIRDGVEIAKGDWVNSFDNGDYIYMNLRSEYQPNIYFLMRDGKEITMGEEIKRLGDGSYYVKTVTVEIKYIN